MGVTVDIEHRPFEATLAACEARGGVDLIVTSPPYPNARPGQYFGDAPHDWTWPDYQRLGDHAARALRPGGFCAINIDGPVRTTRPEVGSERSLIAFELAIDWARRVGLRYVEHCAYVRDGIPGRFGVRWRGGWEPLHVLQKPGSLEYFDPDALKVPSTAPGRVQDRRSYRSGQGYGGIQKRRGWTTGDYKHLTTAIVCDAGRVGCDQIEHPAQFSTVIADAFVLCYCPPGGTVCDPFVGSGTVAISCAKHGRNFIGGDLGARERDGRRWADIARERALEVADPAQQALFG